MLVDDRFRLVHRLGEGGTSVVWAAESVPEGAPLAVKLGRPDERTVRRFAEEARITAAIGGPHVVRVHGSGVLADGRPWLAMDRLVGRDLGALIRQDGPLPADALLVVLGPVAAALHAAHLAGIVHRDVKPENVFLHGPPTAPVVKLLDFGGQDVLGTPLYMSPEQARRWSSRVGRPTDVWGFGMTALAALTGDVYWPGADTSERLEALVRDPMYPPRSRWPWLPPQFDSWFLTACAREPDDRFVDILTASDSLQASLLDAATPMPVPTRLPWGATWSEDDEEPPPRAHRTAPVRGPLVGREEALADLTLRLSSPTARLVSVVGPGGVGKSALAAHAVASLAATWPDGVCHLPLAHVQDLSGAYGVLDAALGSSGAGLPRDCVLRALSRRHLLLLVDDAERLAASPEMVSELLLACPAIVVLATSRTPLGLPEEVRFSLAPLPAPPPDVTDPVEASRYPAVTLFTRLASRARPDFRVGPANVATIAQIVRRFDGLPLAIELGAARLRDLTLDELLARLESGVLLGDEDGHRPTLRATLRWSWQLLPEPARDLAEQLALFVGGFGLEAARSVGRVPAGTVDDALVVLVDHSLVQVADGRHTMLETVRGYALERLVDRPDRTAVEERWLDWAVEFSEAQEVGAERSKQVDVEHETLRAALESALSRNDGVRATRMAGALAGFWTLRGHYREGSELVDRALAQSTGGPVRAKALATAGRLALLQCEYARARRLSKAAADLYAELGDDTGLVRVVEVVGSVAREQGRYAEALEQHGRCVDLALERGDRPGWARATNYVAFAAWLSGDGARTRASSAEALAVFRAAADPEGVTWSLLNQAATELYGGEGPESAETIARLALDEARRGGFPEGVAWALDLIGVARLGYGGPAAEVLRESLSHHARLGDVWRAASTLDGLARAALVDERPERAARILGAAEGLRARIEVPVPLVERPAYERCVATLSAMLGPAFTASRSTGARLGIERAVAFATEGGGRIRG